MTHKRIGLMKLKNKRMETVAVRQLRKLQPNTCDNTCLSKQIFRYVNINHYQFEQIITVDCRIEVHFWKRFGF